MSFNSPGFTIPRQSIEGMEGMWVKMWDPPTRSPSTPDKLAPTNPVPEVMFRASLANRPSTTNTVQRDLLHGADLSTWDSKKIKFFLFRDKDNPATGAGNFPGATIRVPRGVIFHGESQGHGPPPHTIHWHGIEPTPINDGVGHCSMEVGHYTYQWQPNFIGFYFCHCHRNTVQHFEFGLYQALLIDPPDAYWATLVDPTIPIGAGRDGKRRIAANLAGTALASLPGQSTNALDTADPWKAVPAPPDKWTDDARLLFPTDPHAMTVPFDVEALWVFDDRDSTWSDLAPDARATYPKHGNTPGVDDKFHESPGGQGFFAFNQFNPDYWYVTGVNFAGPRGGSGEIPADIVVPPQLMSGVSGTQVSISADVGQTILVRCLDAAYNCTHITFPVPVTVIAWDGRALGVPPYGQYNHAYDVPANEPIHISVARRFDALIKADTPINSFVTVEFTDTRAGTATGWDEPVLFTGKIPFNIGLGISGKVATQDGFALAGVTVALSGDATKTAVTDAAGNYSFKGLLNGSYTITPSLEGFTFALASIDVGLAGASVTGQDFVATAEIGLYTLSGSVVTSRGAAAGIPGVTVTLSGDASRTAVTDAMGNFAFTGLPNGRYTVTPSSAAYGFNPPLKGVTVRDVNQAIGAFRGRQLMPM